MRPWPALLFAALLLPAPAGGQPVTRRAFVDATQASGVAVLDLKPADFRVTEAGETREVTSAALTRRPLRIVLLVDTSDAIRQQIGQIRQAITTFLESLDAGHEMMAYESTQNINPREITHITDHFISRAGTMHSIRLIGPTIGQIVRGGSVYALPVTQMVARDSGEAYTETSPSGLLDVLQRLAGVINDSHASAPMSYQIDYAGTAIKGRKIQAPDVRVNREGVQLKVFASP